MEIVQRVTAKDRTLSRDPGQDPGRAFQPRPLLIAAEQAHILMLEAVRGDLVAGVTQRTDRASQGPEHLSISFVLLARARRGRTPRRRGARR